MFTRWASYSLRMRNARQKYFTLLRRNVSIQRTKILVNMRNKIIKGVLGGSIAIGTFLVANQFYSQHLEKKKMKKKLMKSYPDQTYIISYTEDPMQLLQQVQIKNTVESNQQVKQLKNNHCLYLQQHYNQQDSKQIIKRLGQTIIVFCPKSMDQLCNALQRCHKYRHTAVVGNYPVPASILDTKVGENNQSYEQLKKYLQSIEQPVRKSKYIIIDLSRYNKMQLDLINYTVMADVGVKCQQLNKLLIQNNFQRLFLPFCKDLTVFDVISHNLPLYNSKSLVQQIKNLSLVSAEGARFKSSTQVQKFGQIPNLTPLFIGTGGAFSVPANAILKIKKANPKNSSTYSYSIVSNNQNDLILKWRQMKQYLSTNNIDFTVYMDSITKKFIIQTKQPINLSEYIGYKAQTNYLANYNSQNSYIFSINNRILQKLILIGQSVPYRKLSFHKDLLQVQIDESQSQTDNLNKLISDISVQGGVLVWCKDRKLHEKIKQRTDLTEVSAQLMKKIVQIREGIDKRQVLHSHNRYEKYFAKSFFRKITQVFW